VLELQAWSIGFAGRVTDSQVVDIAFQ